MGLLGDLAKGALRGMQNLEERRREYELMRDNELLTKFSDYQTPFLEKAVIGKILQDRGYVYHQGKKKWY